MSTLNVGDKIWRMTNFISSLGKVYAHVRDDYEFAKSHRGDAYVFKAVGGITFFCESGSVVADEMRAMGIVCFFKKLPPDDWTYFEVTSVGGNGNSVTVEPRVGSMEEFIAQHNPPPNTVW